MLRKVRILRKCPRKVRIWDVLGGGRGRVQKARKDFIEMPKARKDLGRPGGCKFCDGFAMPSYHGISIP